MIKGGNLVKLSNLFILNAIVALVFGLGFLIIPTTVGDLYGVELSEAGYYVSRLYGAIILGLAVISWFARNAEKSDARDAVVYGFLVSWILGLAVTIYGQVAGILNELGWFNLVLFLIFSLGYLYFQFVKQE
jgi:hypothetical protein